ncbi:histidine phosphatase family protein [Aquisediminimonas sediminicola]|uniref:histidine phosphatase family protein n=1 Tax=Alteraquisediminimonas sediminicola TaxID=2676787 RepID=UPI001C8D97AE|nr:histidine phosphatase family protein [Aquisediminimonas sediminicola]
MTTELLMIRHAHALHDGRLAGRRDVSADCADKAGFAAICARLGRVDHCIASPAIRCRQTAAALWPEMAPPEMDERLWEQDFGQWEGLYHDEIPDLGPLSAAQLVEMRPPQGESFADLCARARPALESLIARKGRIAVIAHAGTVRAALALALGAADKVMGFEIAPLSLTKLTHVADSGWSIGGVNWTASSAGGA